jgi:hypothetical protein
MPTENLHSSKRKIFALPPVLHKILFVSSPGESAAVKCTVYSRYFYGVKGKGHTMVIRSDVKISLGW